jgi:integrase
VIRNAKALFSKKIVRKLGQSVSLPDPLPFSTISTHDKRSLRYHSRIDVPALFRAAISELDQEPLKCFILCVALGLRKKESDTLQWSQIDLERGTVTLEDTDAVKLKSEASGGTVAIDTELMPLFRGWREDVPEDLFVLRGNAPRPDSTWAYYRAEETHRRLLEWLRAQPGLDVQKPLHTLRKECGSLVAQRHGIHAASRFLRHSDITITSKFYVDDKERVTPGLGELAGFGETPQENTR